MIPSRDFGLEYLTSMKSFLTNIESYLKVNIVYAHRNGLNTKEVTSIQNLNLIRKLKCEPSFKNYPGW